MQQVKNMLSITSFDRKVNGSLRILKRPFSLPKKHSTSLRTLSNHLLKYVSSEEPGYFVGSIRILHCRRRVERRAPWIGGCRDLSLLHRVGIGAERLFFSMPFFTEPRRACFPDMFTLPSCSTLSKFCAITTVLAWAFGHFWDTFTFGGLLFSHVLAADKPDAHEGRSLVQAVDTIPRYRRQKQSLCYFNAFLTYHCVMKSSTLSGSFFDRQQKKSFGTPRQAGHKKEAHASSGEAIR